MRDKRRRGGGQDQAKPLLKEDLFQVLDAMGDGVKDARDQALLLLIGFAGGFRRSEIVGLDVDDLEKGPPGSRSFRYAARKPTKTALGARSAFHLAVRAFARSWLPNAG